MKELTRMTSRDQIKGNIRKLGQNPHESRFGLPYDAEYWSSPKPGVEFERMLKRNNLLFKSLEFSPDYNPNSDFTRKLLATHLMKF